MRTAAQTKADALVERVFAATIGLLELAAIHIGDRLGFYRSLDEEGPATSAELAASTGTVERHVREWLEQQAVAGILSVADPDATAGARRYGLPAGHRVVLVEHEELDSIAPLARAAIRLIVGIDAVLAAYRTGSVVVGDEPVADRFSAPGDDLERFNYGWSVLHGVPVGMLEPDSE